MSGNSSFNLIEWEKGILSESVELGEGGRGRDRFQSHRVRKGDFKHVRGILVLLTLVVFQSHRVRKGDFKKDNEELAVNRGIGGFNLIEWEKGILSLDHAARDISYH